MTAPSSIPAETLTTDQATAIAFAARHVNAFVAVTIPDHVLIEAVRTGTIPDGFEHHLHAFIDETDVSILSMLVISRAATYRQLSTLAGRLLPPTHPNREWLDDRQD